MADEKRSKKSFVFYLDTKKQWDMLTDKQAGILIKALLNYASTGEFLATDDGMLAMAFSFMASQIDRDCEKYEQKCAKNREIALKREEARKAAKESSTNVHERERTCTDLNERTRTYTNVTDNDTDNDIDNDSDSDSDNIILTDNINIGETAKQSPARKVKKQKPVKHRYGEYQHVQLTDDQYRKLLEDFGDQVTQHYIKTVDEYCQVSGKTYKDYNLTIRNFKKRDEERRKSMQKAAADMSAKDLQKMNGYLSAVNRFGKEDTG